MQFDLTTIMAIMAIQLFTLAAVLPWLMGRRVSTAARSIQIALLLQAGAASAILTATVAWDFALSVIAVAFYAGSLWALFRTLTLWLGPRPYEWILIALLVATPAGYALTFDYYTWRSGWANGLLTIMMLIVARATLHPVAGASTRWRFILCGCLVATAVVTLMRGSLAVFTSHYSSFLSPHPLAVGAAVVTNIGLILGTVALLVGWRSEAERKLRTLAITDSLTKLINRRGFAAQGNHMLAHARRHQIPLTALMMDLDHFKDINDRLGHAAGDKALAFFARHLQDICRSGDLVARLGGEEFGALLLHNSTSAGASFDRRLRKRLSDLSLFELGYELNFSAGMAVLAPGETSLSALMARADAAMYQAKTSGRGRLVVQDNPVPDRAVAPTQPMDS